jgi:heme-degrading monooxygenase HmoA
MLVERAELLIKGGSEDGFAAAMAQRGRALLLEVDGVIDVRLGRGVENPRKFMLLITWTTMDGHAAFTRHPLFQEFRDLIGPFTIGGGMEHFDMS